MGLYTLDSIELSWCKWWRKSVSPLIHSFIPSVTQFYLRILLFSLQTHILHTRTHPRTETAREKERDQAQQAQSCIVTLDFFVSCQKYIHYSQVRRRRVGREEGIIHTHHHYHQKISISPSFISLGTFYVDTSLWGFRKLGLWWFLGVGNFLIVFQSSL